MKISKRHIVLKIIALLLAAACMLPAAGCKKEEEVVKTKPENVYKSTYIPIEGWEYVENMTCDGERVYFSGYSLDGGRNQYQSMKLDGTDVQSLEFIKPTNDNSYINRFIVTSSGDYLIAENEWTYNEETGEGTDTYRLVKIDSNGNDVFRVDVREIIGSFVEDEYIYLNNIGTLSDGRIIATMNAIIFIISPTGELLSHVDFGENSYVNRTIISGNDNIYVLYYDNTEQKNLLKVLDIESGKLNDSSALSEINGMYYYNLIAGFGESPYGLYYNDNTCLYGIDETTGQSVALVNWINSDINSNMLNNITVLTDKHIICVSMDWSSTPVKTELISLTYIPPEEVVEKYIMTLACSYLDSAVRNAVIKFNRTNDEYRIQIKNYAIYNTEDDRQRGVQQFNNDIVAGNIPDIVLLRNNEMPIASYNSKGLFADLFELIDNDPEMKREDYFTNIFDAMSVDGKLYQMTPGFSVMTLAGKTKFVGETLGWTMDEFNETIAKYPDMQVFYDVNRNALLEHICIFSAAQYINKDTGECSFDSDSFKKVLAFAATLSQESIYDTIDWSMIDESFWLEQESNMREDRVLLEMEYIGSFNEYWRLIKGTFGEDITLKGFPCDSRNGSSFSPTLLLSMSSRTQFKDAAWAFMRYFLTDEYQSSDSMYDWPMKLSRVEELAEEAMTPRVYTYFDENGNEVEEVEENVFYMMNDRINIGYIDRETADELIEFLKSLQNNQLYDNKLLEIITEEAGAYFAGEKSVDETVKIIQNRVQTYVSENR